MGCECRRIKRNFPFGRNSKPRRFCKDCGKTITSKDLGQKNQNKLRKKKNHF